MLISLLLVYGWVTVDPKVQCILKVAMSQLMGLQHAPASLDDLKRVLAGLPPDFKESLVFAKDHPESTLLSKHGLRFPSKYIREMTEMTRTGV